MWLTKQETLLFALAIGLSSFVMAFRSYGTRWFDIDKAILDLLIYLVLFSVIYFIFIISQKFVAIKMGYIPEFKLWSYGPLLSLLVTFMSFGLIPYLYFGAIELKTSDKTRMGFEYKHVVMRDLNWVGLTGPIAVSLVAVLILEPLYFFTRLPEIQTTLYVTALILVFTMIPTPYSNGANILLGRKAWWFIMLFYAIIALVLVNVIGFLSFLLAFIIGLLLTIPAYYYLFIKD